MKRFVIGFVVAVALIGTVAFMRQQQNGILISGGFGGEPKLQAQQSDQKANWIQFDNFAVPASGIIPLTYGGTGGSNAVSARASLGIGNASTNTVVPVVNGGTGATNVLGALTNLTLIGITTNIQLSLGTAVTNTLYFTNGVLRAVTNP